MRIMPCCNMYNNTQIYSEKKSLNSTSKNITFGDIPFSLIALVAKEGKSAIQKSKKVEFVKKVNTAVSDMYYNSEKENQIIIGAIAKLNDSYFTKNDSEGFITNLLNFGPFSYAPSLADLRGKALQNLDFIDDNSHYAIQTKKDFMSSIIDNGHEITQLFTEKFVYLDDDFYKNFKEEILDKILYSRNYNSTRHNVGYSESLASYTDSCKSWGACEIFSNHHYRTSDNKRCEQLYNNLGLIAELDQDVYSRYIKKNRNIIEQSKQYIERFLPQFGNSNLADNYERLLSQI